MSEMYALVLSFHGSDEKPKIVKANEMYDLTSDFKAIKLTAKSAPKFSKTREYGRKIIIDGQEKMVRHTIFAVNDSIEELKAVYEQKKKRFVLPKRLSISAVVEDVDSFSYPDKRKEYNEENKAKKVAVSKSKVNEQDRIMAKYKKTNKAKLKNEASTVNESLKGQSTSSSTEHADSNEEIVLNEIKKETTEDEKIDGQDIHSSHLDVKSLTEIGEIMVADERSRRANAPKCCDKEHKDLQETLHDTLCKLEDANREIGRLKDELNSLKDLSTVKSDIANIKVLLSEMDKPGEKKASTIKTTCEISEMSSLLALDKEEVPADKIKVDEGKFVSKADVIQIERSCTYLTARIEKLCKLFFDNQPAKYSLSGFDTKNKALIKITDTEVQSMLKILKGMAWNYEVTLVEKSLRSRISRYTSDARKEDPEKQKALEKKLESGSKRPNSPRFRGNPKKVKNNLSRQSSSDSSSDVEEKCKKTGLDDAGDEQLSDKEDGQLNTSIHLED